MSRTTICTMIDAIAQVLCIDDYEFSLSLRRGEPIKGGKVMVSIS